MPPKKSSGKEKEVVHDDDDILQAVVLADSFNERFKPLTLNKPRCLLSMCNAKLLDWTFESLAMAGVQEIFVICRSHADLVKAAIKESKWSNPSSELKIVPVVTAKECFSVGDAMRDVYTHGFITNDFILVMGDLVSNIQIDEVVRLHKERRRTNKDTIMTIVAKEAGAVHRTRSRGDTSIFVLDANTSECLHYEATPGYPPKSLARIPRNIMMEHPELDIRNDLIDCSVDICSVEVPSLFQDNFDYQDIRRDFVHGVLTSDLLGKSIYCHIVKDGYAARVKDTKSYASVSKDILARWTFPLVPDENHPGEHLYKYERGNKYVAIDSSGKDDFSLSSSCTVGPNTLIGSGSSISHHSNIHGSVIGEKCSIGAETLITNSYIWNGAVIEDKCTIQESIIGMGVHVKSGSKIQYGCLIADGVILGPNANLQKYTRVSKRRDANDIVSLESGHDSEQEEVEAVQTDEMRKALGKDSNAIIWPIGPSEDDEDLDSLETYDNQRLLRLGDRASDLYLSDDGSDTPPESDADDDDDDVDEPTDISGLNFLNTNNMSTFPSSTLVSGKLDLSHIGHAEFQNEVKQSLDRAFTENHSVENAAVELKTLRMASNVPLRLVHEAVIASIVNHIPAAPNGVAQHVGKILKRWGGLIPQIGGSDGVEIITILQKTCASDINKTQLFGHLLIAMYQMDIVEEDHIRSWHNASFSKPTEKQDPTFAANMQKCWAYGTQILQQLDEDSDETESEDDD